MRHIRCFHSPITEGEFELIGPQTHYLSMVLRLGLGDIVEVFDGLGSIGTARVVRIDRGVIVLSIDRLERHSPRRLGRVVIAAGIAKGQRFDWLIGECTELGVDHICPVRFERTVKLVCGPAARQRYDKLAISSAQQSGRTFLPRIDPPGDMAEVVVSLKLDYPDAVLLLGGFGSDAVWLSEFSFGPVLRDMVMIIGPEGGLTDGEISFLRAQNVQEVRLTATVLRVETAAIAGCATLCCRRDAY